MKSKKMLAGILIVAIMTSFCSFTNVSQAAGERQSVDISSAKLSSSPSATTGITTAGSNIIMIDSLIDFEVGQGIAIQNAERISDKNGSPNYTWFVAEITDINPNTKEIQINRELPVSLSGVIIKHDNYFPFKNLAKLCNNNKEITIPKGDYEVNAMPVRSHLSSETASTDVESNENDLYGIVMHINGISNFKIDFSGSRILLNGNFHRNEDAAGESRTNPVSFLSFTDCGNIEVCNVEIDGRANTATKSAGVGEPPYGDYGCGIRLNGIWDSKFENIKLSNNATDGMLLTQSDMTGITKNVTLRNIIFDSNARQGLTVGTSKGLNIENCQFINTGYTGTYGGHAPMSGIDFEIESTPTNKSLEDVTVKNCFFSNNRSRNLTFYSGHANMTVNNILFENTVFEDPLNGTAAESISYQLIMRLPVQKMTFKDCLFTANKPANGNINTYFATQHANQDIRFENCDFLGSTHMESEDCKLTFDNCNFFMEQAQSYFYQKADITGSTKINNSSLYFNLTNGGNHPLSFLNNDTNRRFDYTNSSFYFAPDSMPNVAAGPGYDLRTKPNAGEFTNVKIYSDMNIIANGVTKKVTAGKSVTTLVNSNPGGMGFTMSGSDIPQNEMNDVLKNYNEKRDKAIAKLEAYGSVYAGTKIKLDKTSVDLNSGKQSKLIATITATLSPIIKDIKWSSSNNTVASVDDSGTITAHSAGSSVIIAEMPSYGYQARCTVNVKGGSSNNNNNSNFGGSSRSDFDNGSSIGTSEAEQSEDGTTYTTSDWVMAGNTARSAKDGDTVIVNLKNDIILPAEILLLIKGKDINLIMDLNTYRWTINGLSVGNVSSDQSFDMMVSTVYGKPFSDIAENTDIATLNLAHSGEFPFVPVLDWQLDKEHISKKVYLYYYNEATGKLEYISASGVDLTAKIKLVFSHASKYVLTAKILSGSYVQENRDISVNRNSISTVPYFVDNGKHVIIPISSIVDNLVTYIVPKTAVYDYKDNSKSFSDVSGHWAADNISFVTSRDLFSGAGNNKFAPNSVMTRGMLVTAFGKLHGVDVSKYSGQTEFSDVKSSAWYAPYVTWATENGIAAGIGNGKFAPDNAVTREQLAVMIVNYAKFTGYNLTVAKNEVTFSDTNKTSKWARDSVKTIQTAGIMSGKLNNEFDPKGLTTRAEASTVLRNYIEGILENK